MTIAALASAAGSGERAVIRLSGPHALEVARGLLTPARGAHSARKTGVGAESRRDESPRDERLFDELLPARGAYTAWVRDAACAQQALLVWMPGPRSFTGEDVAELHVHGHEALARRVLSLCIAHDAVRLAEPGEFTRRAFENGRIDLTRAEGVAALVSATSEEQRRAAIALLTGGLERRVQEIRESLESARTLAEASLDFDEADTGHVPTADIEERVRTADDDLSAALSWERQRESGARARPRVVLAGLPNAGKSTLFNQLAVGDRAAASGPALVSDVHGTTRDIKRASWDLSDGRAAAPLVVELSDTAGLIQRTSGTSLDLIADDRAIDAIQHADVVLWVTDAAAAPAFGGPGCGVDPARTIYVLNKIDRVDASARLRLRQSCPPSDGGVVELSAAKRLGLSSLTAAVRAQVAAALSLEGAGGLVGVRHLAGLAAARDAVARALHGLSMAAPLDLIAEELKAATDALDSITGRTAPEDLLTRIFAAFCLGK